MKRIISLLLVCTMIFGLVACSAPPAAEGTKPAPSSTSPDASKAPEASAEVETIKIGLCTQYSGTNTNQAEEILMLTNLLVDIINEEHPEINIPLAATAGLPNLGGAKIELVKVDSTNTDTVKAETERAIVRDGVVAIGGGMTTGVTKVGVVNTEKYGIPMFNGATQVALLDQGYEYYGRIRPGDDVYCTATYDFLNYIREEHGEDAIKTIGLVIEDSDFGLSIQDQLIKAAELAGYEITLLINYNQATTNLTSEVLKLKEANPDCVIVSAYTADSILLMKTMKEQNWFPKVMFGQRGGFVSTDFITSLGEDANYVYTSAGWANDLNLPEIDTINKLWHENCKDTPIAPDVMLAAFDVYALILAINQAGSTDADAIMDALREGIDYPADQWFMSMDEIRIDDRNQNVGCKPVIIQYMDGKSNTVFPAESKTTDAVFPAPNWDER